MPNVAKVLKEEILRLAKKEAKAATRNLRADCVALKHRAADQKRRLANLEREVRKLRPLAKDRLAQIETPSEQELRAARISSGMVKRLRAKLDLSQAQLAKLVNVSPISIYMWERKDGRLQLRSTTRTNFLAVRKLGKREARARLAALAGRAPAKSPRKAPTKRRVQKRARRK